MEEIFSLSGLEEITNELNVFGDGHLGFHSSVL